LHQINVLGISQGFFKNQFVNGGATPEGDLSPQSLMVEQVANGTGNHQVLFHLAKVHPWGLEGPLTDMADGNQ